MEWAEPYGGSDWILKKQFQDIDALEQQFEEEHPWQNEPTSAIVEYLYDFRRPRARESC